MRNERGSARRRARSKSAYLVTGAWLAALALALAFGAPRARAYEKIGSFRNTYYLLALETDYPQGAKDSAVLDLQGKTLAMVGAEYKKKLDLEGSGKLKDGRVLNFHARVDGKIRYQVSPFKFGRGVGQCPLEPFHTIAADPSRIPLGSVVQIDETVGMELPDGTKHNGLWKAEDVGSAIQKDRIDLFVGAGDQGWVLEKAGIEHLQALTVRLVKKKPAFSCVDEDP